MIVDGQDVIAVYEAARQARERALAGDGPTFIEAQTYRYEGHNVGDVRTTGRQTRSRDWRAERDPIERLRIDWRVEGCSTTATIAELVSRAPRRQSPTRWRSPTRRRGPICHRRRPDLPAETTRDAA